METKPDPFRIMVRSILQLRSTVACVLVLYYILDSGDRFTRLHNSPSASYCMYLNHRSARREFQRTELLFVSADSEFHCNSIYRTFQFNVRNGYEINVSSEKQEEEGSGFSLFSPLCNNPIRSSFSLLSCAL